jgi:hypothetical protein
MKGIIESILKRFGLSRSADPPESQADEKGRARRILEKLTPKPEPPGPSTITSDKHRDGSA